MLQSKDIFDDGTILGFWKIEETLEELLSMATPELQRQLQAMSFKSDKRRLEFLAVRLLLHTLVETDATIGYKDSGEPYLDDGSYYISITHTREYVGIILNPMYRVGIDVERISDKVVRVRDKFLSDGELAFVEHDNARVHLALMWSVKEAIYKVMPTKPSNIIEQITISPFVPYLEGTIEALETATKDKTTFHLRYRIEPEVCKVWTVMITK